VILLILGFVGFYGFLCFSQQTWSFWIFLEKNSLSVSIVLLAVCWLCVRKLNAARICEKFCDVPAMDVFSCWSADKIKQVTEYKAAKREDRFGVGIVVLLNKLMRSTYIRSVKYGLGLAMVGCGSSPINMGTIITWFSMAILFCYMPIEAIHMRIMFFVIPVVSVIQLTNACRIPILAGCGREERAIGSIIAGLIYTVLIAVQMVLMVLLTVLLDKIMPDISFSFMNGFVLNFEPLKFRYIMQLFSAMPIVYSSSIISTKLGFIVSMVVVYVAIWVTIVDWRLNTRYVDVIASHLSLLVLPLILLCLVSYLIIRRHFLKADFRSSR
jgi:hypothetical protein